MEKYKLKVAARQFFKKSLHDDIYELSIWKKEGIPIELLDEVDKVYINYGHERTHRDGYKSSDLQGWDKEKAEFKFTIIFPEMDYNDYDKVSIPELMDEMQKVTNRFFK